MSNSHIASVISIFIKILGRMVKPKVVPDFMHGSTDAPTVLTLKNAYL
jgi:hypothetical protein